MTNLPYELAKTLKAAGWPQPEKLGDAYHGEFVWDIWDRDAPCVFSPSLSELIAGSGDGFLTLCRVKHSGGVLWQAWGSGAEDDFRVDGATPEEAVANLWLSLQGEKK